MDYIRARLWGLYGVNKKVIRNPIYNNDNNNDEVKYHLQLQILPIKWTNFSILSIYRLCSNF